MKDQPRRQAQDRLTEGQTIFGPPQVTTFDKAFPEIAELKIVATESGHEVNHGPTTQTYTGAVGEFIRCSNHFCNGGFRIADVIREMRRHGETHKEATLLCGGNETSAKGRRVYKKCMNSLQVVVDTKYRLPTTPPTVP